jgi:hypothetical protein
MRVWMTSTDKTRNKAITKAVERSRRSLTWGLVGIDPRGAVSFRYEDNTNLTSSQLTCLLNEMIITIEQFEMNATFYTMLDSGIPRARVRKIMRDKFPKWKNKPTKLYGDTL